MRINEFTSTRMTCPECGGPAYSSLMLAEKQDACYHKVRSRYKVWPSAYASGALVQCRKRGAANWGNKSNNEGVAEDLTQGSSDPVVVISQANKDGTEKMPLSAAAKKYQFNFNQVLPQLKNQDYVQIKNTFIANPVTGQAGVAEGLPQTLRKVVPGYAKREIDKKMDAGKFGKTDADKDANFYRYKKIQDKLKEQGVAEGRDFDRCYDKACQLYDKAQDKNLQPKLVQVADFRGDGSDADQRWTKLPQHVWQHYVVIVGDQVLDPTARQFGPDMPTRYPMSDLDRLWGKQYQIRPRQGIAENFADGRKPGRRGLAKRVGVNCKQSVSKLRKIAKNSSGERQRMAHWCANMKAGRRR